MAPTGETAVAEPHSVAARLMAALLGGALYGMPFVVPALAPVAFVGMAPALWMLCGPLAPRRLRGTVPYIVLTIATAASLFGLPVSSVSVVGMVALASFITMWMYLALFLTVALRRATGWPLAVLHPALWLLGEWAASFHSIGNLAFGLSGYTQFVYPRLIQVADLGGVLLVGALVQLVVGALADAALAAFDRHAGGVLAWKGRARTSLTAAVALVLGSVAYGSFRLAAAQDATGPRLAIIQPALPHQTNPGHIRMVQAKQVGLARNTVQPGEVDLVVFPENAVGKYIEGTVELSEFQALSAELRAPVLAGVNTRTPEDVERWKRGQPEERILIRGHDFRRTMNSVAMITAAGIAAVYTKLHLLPFSEAPTGEWLFDKLGMLAGYRGYIVDSLGYLGFGVPGPAVALLGIPGSVAPPVWTPICFELADARLAREASALGARSFINVTSEGDLGPQIYWDMMAIATLRAVELHVGIARAGNMGISGIIDPWGRAGPLLRGPTGELYGEEGVLKAMLPIGPPERTVYARAGDWIAGVAAIVCVAAILVALRRAIRKGTLRGSL